MATKAKTAKPETNGHKPVNRIASKIGTNGHAEQAEQIPLRPMDLREFQIPIRGLTPLITHKFSDKAKKAIEEKQGHKARGGRDKRDPKAEYLAAMYVMPGTGAPGSKTAKYGIPASGFQKAAMKAARYIAGINMTFAVGAFHVLDDAAGLVQIKYQKVSMREDAVRLNGKSLDLRYRPEFTDWSCILRIKFNKSAISPEQIVNLFQHAGFHIGWGELRPEKGFSNGMFEVVSK